MDEVKRLVDELLKLHSSDPNVSDAINSLIKIGQPAVLGLIDAMKGGNGYVRNSSMDALITIGTPSVDPLIEILTDPNSRWHEKAATILARIGGPSVAPLVAKLIDADPDVRKRIVNTLGWTFDANAVPALINALNDPDEKVRSQAVFNIENISRNLHLMERTLSISLDEFEAKLDECYSNLKNLQTERKQEIGSCFATLKNAVALRRNLQSPDKGILLTEKPRPPKSGKGIYRAMRVIHNG